MSNFLTKFNSKITDPLGFINKVGDKWGMQKVTDLYRQGPLGNAGGIKAAAGSKAGSLLSGRAILQGGAKEQDMETARTFDVFGSPATAGGKQQTSARSLAALYGLIMGGAALAGGGSGAGGGAAGGAMNSSGVMVDGATSGGMGSAGGASASSPAWMKYARLGNMAMNMGQPSGPQQGALQHQFVGNQTQNPYAGYPWNYGQY